MHNNMFNNSATKVRKNINYTRTLSILPETKKKIVPQTFFQPFYSTKKL